MTTEELKVIIRAEVSELNKSLQSTRNQVKATKDSVDKNTSAMTQAFNGFVKKFVGWQAAFKLLEKGVQSVIRAVKQGVTNIYDWSSSVDGTFAKSMDKAKSSINTLTNSIAASFMPVIEAMMPVITKMADGLTNVFNTLAKGAAILTGKSTFLVAKKQADAYTEAAKKAKYATAGFDELNVLKNGSVSTSDSFEEQAVEIETAFDKALSKVKEVLDAIKNKVSTTMSEIVPGIKSRLVGIKETASDLFSGIGPKFLKGFNLEQVKNRFKELAEDAGNKINNIKIDFSAWKPNIDKAAEWLGMVANAATNLGTLSLQVVTDIATNSNWNDILNDKLPKLHEALLDVYTVIAVNFNSAVNKLRDLWNAVGKPVVDLVLSAVGIISEAVQDFWYNYVKPIFEALEDFIDDLWTNSLQPLYAQHIAPLIESIKDLLMTLWQNVIRPVFNYIYDTVVPKIKSALNSLKPVFEGLYKIVGTVFDQIRAVFNIFVDLFKGDWDKLWKDIELYFTAVWYGIYNTFATIINGLLTGINKMTTEAVKAINWVIEKINLIPGVDIKLISEDALTIKMLEYKDTAEKAVSQNDSYAAAKTARAKDNWTYMANGGIVDRATRIIAGEDGAEAIMPLQNNTEWISKLADELAARQTAPSKIVLNLDGREIAQTTITNINKITRATGQLPLVIA